MIGVYCGESEKIFVQEFFELFKTPWEFINISNSYDVIISTRYEMPTVNSRLIIIYSSRPALIDVEENIATHSLLPEIIVDYGEISFPIYGNLLSFRCRATPLIYSRTDSEIVAIELIHHQGKVVRVGFDLFREVAFLLSGGQPIENALFPTLESHITVLRNWILAAGLPLVEVPPLPFGYKYFTCLTHDIDFVGIRLHKFDHTMWGFIYRGMIGSFSLFLRGRINLNKLIRNWVAVFKLPFVYAGVADDFWEHFEKYAEIDNGYESTFFVIPFKNYPGDKLDSETPDHQRRSSPYGIDDIATQVKHLVDMGFEIGLHGIDAWHSLEKGAQELNQVVGITQEKEIGIRMHWLYYNNKSPAILENNGFNYDASLGYNETIGFRNGTMQVFRPFEVSKLLEIPLSIQDTALFYPRRLGLNEVDAYQLCKRLLGIFDCFGGVLTISWHDRSLEPERLWGDFYIRLLQEVRTRGAWIGSARQIVKWFRQRRSVIFKKSFVVDGKLSLELKTDKHISGPPMFLRFYIPAESDEKLTSGKNYQKIDIPMNGEELIEMPLQISEAK